jgi:xylulokinase
MKQGAAQLTVGSGAQLVAPLPHLETDPSSRTHTFRTAQREGWYALAACQNAGLALEWVRGFFEVGWDEFYEEAFSVGPGSEGVVFAPYLTGERTPHFDSAVRGAWLGLERMHSRAHLLRSAMEGVGFSVRQALWAMRERGIEITALRLAGGGTLDPRWRQMLADVLALPLVPIAAAASAYGAAMLAARSQGVDLRVLGQDASAEPIVPGAAAESYRAPYAKFLTCYQRLA